MKKILICFMLYGPVLFAQNNKINIAVLDLDATNISSEDARFLSDRLRIELFDAGTFTVLERDKMNVILNEQGLQMSGCTSVECAVEIGQLLNVQQMVAGSIGRIGNIYSITMRLINVQTGELLKTAKHDYQGELSEMLTSVLPEIALELSAAEDLQNEDSDKITLKENKHWGVQFRFGSAVSALVTDFNNSIGDFNSNFQPDLDEMSQFRTFALTAVLDYSYNWRYNFGIQVSAMTEEWKVDLNDYQALSGITYNRMEFERSFTFVLVYTDVDYKMQLFRDLNFYIGAGLGINSLTSNVKQRYEPDNLADNAGKDSFDYVVLAIRLKAGFDYVISDHFELLAEFSPIVQTDYDTKDEYPGDDAYGDFKEIVYPETMNGTMSVITLGFTYFF